MKKLASTAKMGREEWLQYRRLGLGGSDAGAICGMNPYSSPMKVYCDKAGLQEPAADNEAMRQGRDLEEYVARRFTEETGKKVRRSLAMYQHEQYPFMLANVDRLVVGEKAGLECKTANAFQAFQWKDGKIPPHYEIQCHHYLAVTGLESWYLAVVILGVGFQLTEIRRDERMIQNLIKIEKDFWENHVLKGLPPEPDGSEACEALIRSFYPSSARQSILLPDSFNKKLDRREELQRLIEKLQEEQRQIEQEVKLYMKEGEMAVNERYRVTWSEVKSSRLDAKRLKEEQPEIYRDFSKVTTSRRFSVKAA